jgi:hypothetical protein
MVEMEARVDDGVDVAGCHRGLPLAVHELAALEDAQPGERHFGIAEAEVDDLRSPVSIRNAPIDASSMPSASRNSWWASQRTSSAAGNTAVAPTRPSPSGRYVRRMSPIATDWRGAVVQASASSTRRADVQTMRK